MGQTNEGASEATAPRLQAITLPPRSSFETLFTGLPGFVPGPVFSPGPMTLVSNFFSDNNNSPNSFSQLLAGAMASPVAAISSLKPVILPDNSTHDDNTSKGVNCEGGSENNFGFKQNRPMALVVGPSSPVLLFPTSGLLNSPGFFSPLQSPFGMSHQQALAHVTAQAALSQSYMHTQAEYQPTSLAPPVESSAQNPSFAPNETIEQETHTIVSGTESSKMELSEVSQPDRKSVPASVAVDKPANDGYNWRKYGQKQVKKSEHPRSYYKCTHLTCPVKKKVERSPDGEISEIIYKGQHNHELPRSNKRVKVGDVDGTTNTQLKSDLGELPRSNKRVKVGDVDGNTNTRLKSELGSQSPTEMSESKEALPSHSVPRKNHVSTQPTSKQLPGSSEHDEMDDAEIVIDEGGNDEPNSKRRSTEAGASDPALSHKTITESRIIVQTRSEVDILDDGYKWRKYGQKAIKGNPHPRSYYRCTFVGCNVRKHVERASADPKAVITTYEGKHNHDNSHITANGNELQSKPQKAVARKLALHVELDFGSKDQRPELLQLKEEKITA